MSEQIGSRQLQLHVQGPNAGAELTLYDPSFKPLMSAVGELSIDLPPGLYDLEARIANRSERKTVALVDDAKLVKASEWDLKFRTAAPLALSSSLRDVHQQAAFRYSREPTWSAPRPGNCRFFLFLRSVGRERNGEWKKAPEKLWTGVRLHGADGKLISDFSEGVQSNAAEGWCALTVDLPEGGYVVSAPAPVFSTGDNCLPIWLQSNYETHLFIPFYERPALDALTLTMAPMGAGFVPERQTAAEYSEALLAGFRRNRNLVNPSYIRQMLADKFYNPFAGIVAAHALIRDSERKFDDELLREVSGNLRMLLGDHPDVLALEIMSEQSDVTLKFPPILRLSFDGVLSRSAWKPDIIEVNDIISEALGTLLPEQYTLWRRKAPTVFQLLTKLRDGALKFASGIQAPALAGVLGLSPARRHSTGQP